MTKFHAESLAIPDILLIRTEIFPDPRGSFMETYNRREFAALGVACEFVQDNHSVSARRGTIRGLHFQAPPRAQTKLVRVVKGSIFDVAADLRRGSPAFAKWCGVALSANGAEQLLIPRRFAHAFCTLEPNTEVIYKVDDYYAPECESGLAWNDPAIAIEWPVAEDEVIVSEKDARFPRLADFTTPFDG